MMQVSKRTVIDYKYWDENEAMFHEMEMKRNGWTVESSQHVFIKHFRRYSKEIPN
jgi:hypothetical protein